MARAHGVSRLRGAQRLVLGQIDWTDITQNLITTAGAVAARAVTPPTYSSTVNPYTGAQSVTSYAPVGSTTSLLGTSSLSSLLTSPIVLLGGLALVAAFALKR